LLLKDKVAIITGGSYGIGRGIAQVFAENGAEVIICARGMGRLEDTCKIIYESTGVKAHAQLCDVSVRADVERVRDFAMDTFGRIDILVNNAGVQRYAPMIEMTDQMWDEHFAVNTKGVFLFSQVVAREMVKARKGVIVNVASDSGCAPLPDNASAYCASKAAVISFTRNTAKELGPYGVRCNCICPGACLVASGWSSSAIRAIAAAFPGLTPSRARSSRSTSADTGWARS